MSQRVSCQRIVAARLQAPFTSTGDLALRANLDAGDLKALASADALSRLSGQRRQQVWKASALHATPPLLKEAPIRRSSWPGQDIEDCVIRAGGYRANRARKKRRSRSHHPLKPAWILDCLIYISQHTSTNTPL